jgi:mRNA-degrading endonuclease RelE of RelBE toxin-antitoxin system
VFEIRFAEGVENDLKKIRAYYRNQIVDAIEEQLAYTPETPTKNRKLLENLIPPWESVPPIWELRVGQYRVFYDVARTESVVYVRAVRKKPRQAKTGDIL